MLEAMFIAAQGVALIGWAALFALPWLGLERARLWARCAAATLALLYLAYLVPDIGRIPLDRGYTLAALAGAFETRELLLAGWIHYLVLDLWVGSWQAEDARRWGLGHGALVLCLFTTMLIGPLGLLLYLAIAATARARRRDAPERL
jgi:hypothetical protein